MDSKISSFSSRTIFSHNCLPFWGGFAMAMPFYAEFFSWYLVVAMLFPLFLTIAQSWEIPKLPPLVVLPMISLLLLHAVALVFSDTPFEFQVKKDLILALLLLFIYLVVGSDMLKGFFCAIVPLGIITAILGLIKASLLDRGYLVGLILDSCYYYPAGSALCVNYNNLGLIWLVSALGCLRAKSWYWLPLLIAAGLLSSSRRFIVLVAFIPILMYFLEGKDSFIKLLVVSVLTATIVYIVSDPESFERYRIGEEPYKVVLESEFFNMAGNAEGKGIPRDISINRSTPTAMLGTMTDSDVGTDSRQEYWQAAFSMLGWQPQAWSYHKIFSCKFSNCDKFVYPHMSIMSEWLIGGAVFGIVAILFYFLPCWVVLRGGSIVHIYLLLFSIPYSLISGDTVFSLPIVIASMLVALGVSSSRKGRQV